MLLDLTTQTLEIKLAGAVATNELPIVLYFIDGESSNFFPKLQHSVSNGTTEVTVLGAPEERGKRMVKNMTIRNTDTSTVTITVQLADGGTDREIYKVKLLKDETLFYSDTSGFKVLDTDGNIKVGGGVTFGTPSGDIDIADSAAEGSSGNHSRSDHQHKFTAPSSGYPVDVDGAAEADGSATTPARSDHRHHVTVAVTPSDVIAGASAEGSADGLARGDHKHKALDIGARVFNDAAITLTTATDTILTFNQERYDTDTIHSTSSNTGRLTATTAGKYIITGMVRFATNSTGFRKLGIFLNGTTLIALQNIEANDAAITAMVISTVYLLTATDYVELQVQQTSGGNLDIESNSNYSPEFAMQKIG